MSFLQELKRRNVLRVAAAYIVTAWLIVQVVETLFPIYGLSDEAIRLVVNVLAIGLIPVLILSWVFEWTPEGLKRDAEVDHSTALSLDAAKRLDRVILVVLTLALGYFAFDKFVLDPARDVEIAETAREEGRSEAFLESFDQSIAVLAFDDMSQHGDQEYLSDGIAEEILHLLEKIDGLRVISRTSAFSYKGKDIPITTIAEQLDVVHILEGSVRKAGDRIRVTAQLIDARTDTHLWSETYDRTLDDIFAIQDELAAAMVAQLHIELLGEAPVAKRVDPEAYMLYLEGLSLSRDNVDFDQGVLLLEQAVRIQPDYFDAWLQLSNTYALMSTTFFRKDHEGDDNYFRAEATWEKAVSLNSTHPAILAGEAWNIVQREGDWSRAARLVEQAIAAGSDNWNAMRYSAAIAGWLRRGDVGVALLEPLIQRDPLCGHCSWWYSRVALFAGEYEKAEQEILRFQSLVPGSGGEMTLAKARLLAGDIEGARQVIESFPVPTNPGWAADMGARKLYLDLLIRLTVGDLESVAEDIASFRNIDVRSSGYPEYADLYAMLGETDLAFDALEQYRAENVVTGVAGETRSPFLAKLHDDPRWDALLEEIGLAPHQLAEINFDPKLPGQ